MSALARILCAIALMGTTCVQAEEPPVWLELPTQQVRLRDIAIGFPADSTLGERIVAHLSPGAHQLTLGRERVERILRLQAPALALVPRWEGEVTLIARQSIHSPDLATGCSALSVPVAAGAFVEAEMLSAIACQGHARISRGIVFDRAARSLRATTDLPGGTYLGRIRANPGTVVPAGSALILRTGSGPVIVERTVRTIQPGREGEPVFVRTTEGRVLVGHQDGAVQ